MKTTSIMSCCYNSPFYLISLPHANSAIHQQTNISASHYPIWLAASSCCLRSDSDERWWTNQSPPFLPDEENMLRSAQCIHMHLAARPVPLSSPRSPHLSFPMLLLNPTHGLFVRLIAQKLFGPYISWLISHLKELLTCLNRHCLQVEIGICEADIVVYQPRFVLCHSWKVHSWKLQSSQPKDILK